MSSLADRVNARLKVTGITPAALARATNVSAPSVANWMSGKTKAIKGEYLLLAAQALQCSPRWLSTGLGPVSDDSATLALVAREEVARYVIDPAIDEATRLLTDLDHASRAEALLWLRGFAAGRKSGHNAGATNGTSPGRSTAGG